MLIRKQSSLTLTAKLAIFWGHIICGLYGIIHMPE